MPSMISNSATLLSVFPIEVEAYRLHNGFVTYMHPAAQKDKVIVRTYNPNHLSNVGPRPVGPMFTDEMRDAEPSRGYSLLHVYDTFIWTRDWTQDAERYVPHPLSAFEVATDLHRTWTSDVIRPSGNHGPGMKVLSGDSPTPDDIAECRGNQEVYFRGLINDAHEKFSRGQVKDISDLHRAAAKWMGANNLPWVPKIEQVEMKKCKACGNDIRSEALRCEHCNVDLPDFYRKYAIEVNPLEDPGVAALLGRLAKPKAA